jgi:hypothetical protein
MLPTHVAHRFMNPLYSFGSRAVSLVFNVTVPVYQGLFVLIEYVKFNIGLQLGYFLMRSLFNHTKLQGEEQAYSIVGITRNPAILQILRETKRTIGTFLDKLFARLVLFFMFIIYTVKYACYSKYK